MAANHGSTKIPGQFEGLVQRHCAFRPVGDWYEDYSHIGDPFRGSGGLRLIRLAARVAGAARIVIKAAQSSYIGHCMANGPAH
jgi:hypothetical protein